jgi:hypothetical protein
MVLRRDGIRIKDNVANGDGVGGIGVYRVLTSGRGRVRKFRTLHSSG